MITFVGHDDTYLLLALIPNLLRQHLISYHSCSVLSAYERERERYSVFEFCFRARQSTLCSCDFVRARANMCALIWQCVICVTCLRQTTSECVGTQRQREWVVGICLKRPWIYGVKMLFNLPGRCLLWTSPLQIRRKRSHSELKGGNESVRTSDRHLHWKCC